MLPRRFESAALDAARTSASDAAGAPLSASPSAASADEGKTRSNFLSNFAWCFLMSDVRELPAAGFRASVWGDACLAAAEGVGLRAPRAAGRKAGARRREHGAGKRPRPRRAAGRCGGAHL